MKKINFLIGICLISSLLFGCGKTTHITNINETPIDEIVQTKTVSNVKEKAVLDSGKYKVNIEIIYPAFSEMNIAEELRGKDVNSIKKTIIDDKCPMHTETVIVEIDPKNYDEDLICKDAEKEVLAKELAAMIDKMEDEQSE